ncbi:MAG: putative methicillin resistance protein [Thermoleophilia bacterium]|nr:putative methicillin resistance protein [Thermoleophilia bacterium]
MTEPTDAQGLAGFGSHEPNSERAAYDAFLATARTRTVFAESWWLDLVTGSADGWLPNVVTDSEGRARAAWPLVVRRERAGLVGIGAGYTPLLGPQLPQGDGGADGASLDVTLLDELAAKLCDYAHVESACAPEFGYWTPLSWHGFEQTTRTTWRIPAGRDEQQLRAALRTERRRNLASAEAAGLVAEPAGVDELMTACAATFLRQGADVPRADLLRRIATESLARGRAQVLAVRSADGALASAGLFVHDDRFTWNLANGHVDLEGAKGAPTLLQWSAILAAQARGTGFDFEGSMIRPIERFVRGFGGEPHAYSVVRRSSPEWARMVARKRAVKRLLGRR